MQVAVGQTYQDARWSGRRGLLRTWCVIGLFEGSDGIPHAKLVASDNRVDRKTVSCAALGDHRLFSRLDAR